MLIYGPYGVGKTQFASGVEEIPEMMGALMVNLDLGDEVLEWNSKIDLLDFKKYRQMTDLYYFLLKHCELRDKEPTPEVVRAMIKLESDYMQVPIKEIETPRRYRTVITDTLTELQKLCMYQLLGVDIEQARIDEPFTKPGYTEWGNVLEMILLLARKFRSLPINTIFLAQVDEDQDDKKQRFYRPMLQGQAQQNVQGFFDVVGYYTMRADVSGANVSIKRRLYLSPIGPFQAKNRFRHWNGHWLDDPTMLDLYKLHMAEMPTK